MLSQLKPAIELIMERRKKSVAMLQELEEHRILGSTAEMAERQKMLDETIEDMSRKADELQGLGVMIKDLDRGLIDFPADRFGEEVMLCWMYGEPDILYWHRASEGFSGRKPLMSSP